MKKIFFMRHAETQAMVEGIMAGSEYETELSDRGLVQAQQAGKFLKDKGIEVIIVSPMTRTRQTAVIVAGEIGLDKTKVIENDLFIERTFSSYSGRPFAEYKKDLHNNQLRTDGLESLEELYKRVTKGFEWLAKRPEQIILVVSHGAVGRMSRLVDQKLAHDDYRKLKGFGTAEIDEFTI